MLFSKAIVKFEGRELIDPSDGSVLFAYTVAMASNQAACSTQGFFVTLGTLLGPLNNCALSCIYYICVVKLNMLVAKIKKKVEPYLHAIPWMTAIILSSISLATRSINPSYSMCRVMEYRPKGCESDDCARGKDHAKNKLFLIHSVILVIAFVAIIVMMTVIFLKVWRQERRMRNAGYRSTNAARAAGNEANMIAGNRNQAQASNARRNKGLLRQNVTNSRRVLNQALAYTGAYFATWFFSHATCSMN